MSLAERRPAAVVNPNICGSAILEADEKPAMKGLSESSGSIALLVVGIVKDDVGSP
jgi:hypothetical protein